MSDILQARILKSYSLTLDLAESLEEPALKLSLPDLPSNRMGEQFWCIVGARESYTTAIRAGAWMGFSCSLSEPFDKESLADSLKATKDDFESIAFENLSKSQLDFAFTLLEHEVQHHGQLIRFVYGNKLSFPKSWKDRYTV